MLYTGANAYHFGNAIDMVQALIRCPPDKLIMGNIDPVGVMKMSSAKDVKSFTTNLLDRTSGFKNFVLSTGCDLPPHVPAENISAFFYALEEYNKSVQRQKLSELVEERRVSI